MTDAERTQALYDILDEAVIEIEALGFRAGAAPLRAMICFATDRLQTQLCPAHLRADLTRFQRMLGNMLEDIGERQH